MSKFDTKTMYVFEKYLELQHSGEINMASSEVQKRLGITKEEHRFILDNYNALYDEFKDLKVVDELIADAKERVEGKGKGDRDLDFSQEHSDRETDN